MESVQGADCTREHIGLQPPEAAAPVEANSKTQENGLQHCKHDDLLMGVVELDRNTEVITDALAAYPAKAEIVQSTGSDKNTEIKVLYESTCRWGCSFDNIY